jgi:hypothetical protein
LDKECALTAAIKAMKSFFYEAGWLLISLRAKERKSGKWHNTCPKEG